MSKRAVIVSGGELDEELTLREIGERGTGCVIAVDRGLEFLYSHQIVPDYIVGDFDSVSREIVDYYRVQKNVPVRAHNPVKDASDTELAIRLAMTVGSKELLILGATGGRLDHLWANIQSLMIPFKAGIDAKIIDRQNLVRIIGGGETRLEKSKAYGQFFSVFPIGNEIFGFNISGAKYPLKNHTLTSDNSLCVSNEIAGDAEEAVIWFPSGEVILMETRDKD
ncbi:MAG: thiamine diphosphokinase [Dorea sp.]|jgi:thiamine pyrophosphokinase|nr:thiamine diphosphokinase [Dorea sp.]